MEFDAACPSGNLMVHAQNNASGVIPAEACGECGGEHGEHKCVWCLDKISEEQCIKRDGCCEGCHKEQKGK